MSSMKLYTNGNIVTMDPQLGTVEALIAADGKIVFVGSKENALKYADNSAGDVEQVDLGGNTMLPGFIDPHSHFFNECLIGRVVKLFSPPMGEITSIKQIIEVMKAELAKRNLEPGEIFAGFGYEESILEEKRQLTKEDIDQISTEYPVVLFHQSGHVAVGNSIIIEKYAKTEEERKVGLFEETATHDMINEVIKLKPESILENVKKVQDYYASYGITTAKEANVDKNVLALASLLQQNDTLKMDVIGLWLIRSPEDFKGYQSSKAYVNHFRIQGFKFFIDGSVMVETAWRDQPYYKPLPGRSEDYCGYPIHEEDFVYEVFDEAIKRNAQIMTHVNGENAIDLLIKAYKKALENNHVKPEDIRAVTIHTQLATEEQLDAMQELKIVPSFFCDHTFLWGDVYYEVMLGPERTQTICPLKSAINRGLPITLHQDCPVIPPNMLFTVYNATQRTTRSGRVLGKDQIISPYEALKAVTINAAYQYFEEDIKGSLTVGKLADLVILDRNPLMIPDGEIKDIQVLETIKEGRSIYRNAS